MLRLLPPYRPSKGSSLLILLVLLPILSALFSGGSRPQWTTDALRCRGTSPHAAAHERQPQSPVLGESDRGEGLLGAQLEGDGPRRRAAVTSSNCAASASGSRINDNSSPPRRRASSTPTRSSSSARDAWRCPVMSTVQHTVPTDDRAVQHHDVDNSTCHDFTFHPDDSPTSYLDCPCDDLECWFFAIARFHFWAFWLLDYRPHQVNAGIISRERFRGCRQRLRSCRLTLYWKFEFGSEGEDRNHGVVGDVSDLFAPHHFPLSRPSDSSYCPSSSLERWLPTDGCAPRASAQFQAQQIRPLSPPTTWALRLLFLSAAVAFLSTFPTFAPANVFVETGSRLQTTSTGVIFARLATLRPLTAADERLRRIFWRLECESCQWQQVLHQRAVICSIHGFCTLITGPGAVLSESPLASPRDNDAPLWYLLCALPSLLVPHVIHLIVLGLATSSVLLVIDPRASVMQHAQHPHG
ncbi:hypothetical protein MRB53_038143 [Persea americana]|nr:hypothetical protein MRB53_038143 [Persea americana]